MQTIAVPILGDTLPEVNETFFVNLANPVGAAIGDNQAFANGFVGDTDFIQHPLSGVSYRYLVHQVAPAPETAAKVVVTLQDNDLFPGAG